MTKYCKECLRELKPEEEKLGLCWICKERKEERTLTEYNYITDNNPKDSWDDQAPYSNSYTDQYDW